MPVVRGDLSYHSDTLPGLRTTPVKALATHHHRCYAKCIRTVYSLSSGLYKFNVVDHVDTVNPLPEMNFRHMRPTTVGVGDECPSQSSAVEVQGCTAERLGKFGEPLSTG